MQYFLCLLLIEESLRQTTIDNSFGDSAELGNPIIYILTLVTDEEQNMAELVKELLQCLNLID